MLTTLRFDQAVQKLYIAFHNNHLNPDVCAQCAVGNILDNQTFWRHFTDEHGLIKLNYVGLVHQNLGRKFNGYSPLELLKIESSFLKACGFKLPFSNHSKHNNFKPDKDQLFLGLVAVVEELCIIDHLPNLFNCDVLFDYNQNTHPKESQELV